MFKRFLNVNLLNNVKSIASSNVKDNQLKKISFIEVLKFLIILLINIVFIMNR